MNLKEKLRLEKEIYQVLYDTIVFDDINILGKQMDKINAQLEIIEEKEK